METIQLVIEFLGTFAFAISGIRWAASKDFDWFGGYVVGLATASGGGTIRDVMLGVTPFWMTNSVDMICTAAALLTVIAFKKLIVKFTNTWFLFDTLGLALFTVAGLQKTLYEGFPFWVAIIMGSMTGAASSVQSAAYMQERMTVVLSKVAPKITAKSKSEIGPTTQRITIVCLTTQPSRFLAIIQRQYM